MRIVDVRESTRPIASPIRNAYIDFTKMTTSLVAVVTDQVRDGRTVIGYGFNSNGRYGQGGLIRERFAPRLLQAVPDSLLDEHGLLDPHRAWAALMQNEKPGGHGERSVAVGTIDMALWDARAKLEGKPLFAAGLGLGGNESYPDLFQPYGGFPDSVRVEDGHITMPELAGIGFEGKSDLIAAMRELAA